MSLFAFAEVKKIFIKNLLLLQLLNLLVKPLWLLLIDRMAQNILGHQVYGEYYLVLNLTLIANIFLDLGIQNFNNTSIAADAQFFKRNFKSIFLIKTLLSSVYMLLLLFIGLRSGMDRTLLLILTGNQILITFILYLRTNINGLHLYTTDSLLSVSDKFFASIFCIGLYAASSVSLYNFVMAQFAASCMTFAIAFGINIKLWKRIEASVGDKDNLKALLRQSLPYALLFTLMNFYTRMDVAMMNWLLPDAAYHSGLYAQSFRLLDAAAMFAMLFGGLLLPMFSRMIAEKSDLRPLAFMAAEILLFISITVSTAVFLYGEDILKALYRYEDTSQLIQSAAVFKNIMLSFVPMSIIFVYSTILTANKDIWHMNIYAMAAFVCNFTINYLLIPEYQSFGASIGNLCTQSLFALLCLRRCFVLFNFKIPYKTVFAFAALVFMLLGVYVCISSISNLFVGLILFGSVSVLLSLILGIFRIKDILRIFRKSDNKI